jgi:hypothetical protein
MRRGDTVTTGASSSTDGRLGSQILLTVMNPLSPRGSLDSTDRTEDDLSHISCISIINLFQQTV